ncbi:hypothetical protein BpHYR1_007281 [Brachionus plicatilis]|uniref:Uncharacterized protein n=1 Tax=Brachionus plicatilis TaxID=10195 RepID=A0A3M7Q3B8_BRAPC|nr:hypothetical protein BpHYR1_007281 [Brachionus plicatilis]
MEQYQGQIEVHDHDQIKHKIKILPANHPSIGLLSLKVVKYLNINESCLESTSFLKESIKILSICFDKENPIFGIVNDYKNSNYKKF